MADKKNKGKYDVRKLPLPIRPGDSIYFVLDDGTIESDITTSVGIDEDGRLLVLCDHTDYEIGTEDRAFLSLDDAEKYVDDPGLIPEGYGEIDYRAIELPFDRIKEEYGEDIRPLKKPVKPNG